MRASFTIPTWRLRISSQAGSSTIAASACAFLGDGVPTIKCWGYPFTYSTMALPPITMPTAFPSGVRASAFGTGNSSGVMCLIATDGSPWCFGDNLYGQVGNGMAGGGPVLSVTRVNANW